MKYTLLTEDKELIKLNPLKASSLTTIVPNIDFKEPILWQKTPTTAVYKVESLRPEEVIARYLIDAGVNPKDAIFKKLDSIADLISQEPITINDPFWPFLVKAMIVKEPSQQYPKTWSGTPKVGSKKHMSLLENLEFDVNLKFYEKPRHAGYNNAAGVFLPDVLDIVIDPANFRWDKDYEVSLDEIHTFTSDFERFQTALQNQQNLMSSIIQEIEERFSHLGFNFLESKDGYLVDWNYISCHMLPPAHQIEQYEYWDYMVQNKLLYKNIISQDNLVNSINLLYSCPKFASIESVFIAAEFEPDSQEISVLSNEDKALVISQYPDDAVGIFFTPQGAINSFYPMYKHSSQLLYALEYRYGILHSLTSSSSVHPRKKTSSLSQSLNQEEEKMEHRITSTFEKMKIERSVANLPQLEPQYSRAKKSKI